MHHSFDNKYAYLVILCSWTLLFTLIYLYSKVFFNPSDREVYIYLMLFLLYIMALLIKQGIFLNFLSFYSPYSDEWLDKCAQNDLYAHIMKYSEYIIDWALIQGTLIAILIHYNIGNKGQLYCDNLFKSNKKEYKALLEVLDIVEEIYSDNQFKEFCVNISENIKNYKFYLYREKIVNYHKQIIKLYPEIKDSEFKWIFDKFSIRFLLSKTYIDEIINTPIPKRLCICNLCKKFFFSSSKDYICKDCNKRKIIYKSKNTR